MAVELDTTNLRVVEGTPADENQILVAQAETPSAVILVAVAPLEDRLLRRPQNQGWMDSEHHSATREIEAGLRVEA